MGHPKNKRPFEKRPPHTDLKSLRKARKEKLKEKRARLVVRNLPFETTEDKLKELFEKFGELDKINLLRKEDGKLVGCAFVQYKLVQNARKARHYTNTKEFLGRPIQVDFALAKDKYLETQTVKIKEEAKKMKKEEEDRAEIKIKQEIIDVEDDSVNDKTNVAEAEENKGNEVKSDIAERNSESESGEGDDDSVSSEGAKSELDQSDSDEDIEAHSEKGAFKLDETPGRKPHFSNDLNEGKTIFIKNVPFDATNQDLKQCMYQFGPVFYALICVDKFTEHSKGTAFVKFVNKEDAEKALNAGTEVTLLGTVLDCHPALDRDEIHQKEKKKVPSDSRNLYLVKEGVILAGSRAAEGVSASDMEKRLRLEQYKTQMLRNLNMFVSKERLVIQNLPSNWDETKLRTLLKKYTNKDAVLKEVRVMRDLRNVDANGVGKSKEYAFVSFDKHEDALAALRALNNNPNIFSAAKRPIVAFSIENRVKLRSRIKRLEKSKLQNHTTPQDSKKKSGGEKTKNNLSQQKAASVKTNAARVDEIERSKFVGVTSTAGAAPLKMRSRYNLKRQAAVHLQNIKNEKRKKKATKKSLAERRKDFIKQDKQKVNKNPRKHDKDDFSKIVARYKQQIAKANTTKSKWYE